MSDQDIFRLTQVRKTGDSMSGSSGSSSKLYQGGEHVQMAMDLLEAELSYRAAHQNVRSVGRMKWRLSERWKDFLFPKSKNSSYRSEHIRLEKHTSDGWMPVEYTFTEPSIVIDGEVLT